VGGAAVPLKLTVCGLLLALSAMERLPVTAPVAAGAANVTLIVQAAPAPKLEPHVLVWAKLAVGLGVMPVNVKVAVPVLVTVTV
jgi:hypothetical protein